MPVIECFINHKNICLAKFLEKDIGIALIKRNFVDWEMYCLNYLNSMKKFRSLINKGFSIFSKSHNLTIPIDNDIKITENNEESTQYVFAYYKEDDDIYFASIK